MAKAKNEQLFIDVVKTEKRVILEIVDNEWAKMEITTEQGDKVKTDILQKVPLTLNSLRKKFSEKEIYENTIKSYFTKEMNYLRVNGVARENRQRRKKEEMKSELTTEELMAELEKRKKEEEAGN